MQIYRSSLAYSAQAFPHIDAHGRFAKARLFLAAFKKKKKASVLIWHEGHAPYFDISV